MKTKGNILIPVYFNDTEESNITYGIKLANDLNKDVMLVYVFNASTYPFSPSVPGETAVLYLNESILAHKEGVENRFNELIATLSNTINPLPNISYSIHQGTYLTVIKSLFTENKIDMVVTGKQPHSGMFSITPTSYDIINLLECPVWIIPEGAEYKPIYNILYSTDYNHEDIDTIEKVVNLLGIHHPEISLLHVTEDIDFREKVQTEGFVKLLSNKTNYQNIDISAVEKEEDKDTTEMIKDYASDIDAGLVVLLKENKDFMQRVFNASTTKKMIKDAKIPILVYHEHEMSA